MNTSDMVYDQKKWMAEFIGCACFGIREPVNLSDYEDSIAEIQSMIGYYIATGNTREVSEWRKMLQQVRVEKRRAKKMIEKKSRMETAHT